MKKFNHRLRWLFVALLVTTCSLLPVSSATVNASGKNRLLVEDTNVAPPLPESNLRAQEDYSSSDSHTLQRGITPTAYDSRKSGYITPVKNQDPWGACWAFGALASGEANLIKNGAANGSIDLSEMHLSYFMYNTATDPLGLTSGDRTTITTNEKYLDMGGNNIYTMFALAKWTGAAAESTMPYSVGYKSGYSSSLAYKDVAHMQNTRFVSNTDINSIKNLIMEYGAVSTSIYYTPSFQNKTGGYYFPDDTFVGDFSSNHVVTLVGWDDSYSKDKLAQTYTYYTDETRTTTATDTVKPASNGAWIVKNSYGTDEGDKGYIYISYEDIAMVSSGDFFSFAFGMETAKNYDYNYQYDGSNGAQPIALPNGSSVAARYTIKGKSGNREKLSAVAFALESANVNYSIQIYKNPKKSKPTSGTPMLATPQTGKTSYCGYYTIPLNTPLIFEKGDTFSVVIKFTSANGSKINCFIDYTYYSTGIQFVSESSIGQTFYKTSGSWTDMDDLGKGATIRLKAFTTATSASATKVDERTSTLKKPTLALKKKTYKSVTLTWKTIKNAKGYQVYRSTSKYGTYRKIGTTTNLSYTDKKVNTGTNYYYKISAYRTISGKRYYSTPSAIKGFTPSLQKAKITNISSAGSRKIKLQWIQISGANGYEIYRSTKKSIDYKLVKTIKKGSSLSYTNKAPENRTYYYKIRAYRKVNGKKVYGSYSAVRSLKAK